MSAVVIDAQLLARMFLAGARNLDAKKDWINELNVFPVPDGDTGTNMTMTIMSAANEVNNLQELTMERLAKAMSSGSLRGARGNSGVILSQLLRGFCKVIKDKDTLDTAIICQACEKAVETAYKAVMKPKEGTILTVARGCCEKANELFAENPDISLEMMLTESIAYADEVLQTTPELLPVLKEAGVVDSGGEGLVVILQGALDAYNGKEIEPEEEEEPEIPYAYQADFVIVPTSGFPKENEESFKAYLAQTGELLGLAMSRGKVSISVYTDDPGHILSTAMGFGPITDIRIVNLKLADSEDSSAGSDCEKEETAPSASVNAENEVEAAGIETADDEPKAPHKEVGFVAVSSGEGLAEIFKELGVDQIIQGGQTMNPSTQDVINAIRAVNADTVFVFPNNKNIILAASQAQDMVEESKVIVIPTKTIPQGIAAMINYMGDLSAHENEQEMYKAIKQVKTGQITYAVRDTHVDEKEIHKGDYMGVGDDGIIAVGTDLEQTALETIEGMVTEESEIISIYCGENASLEEAEKLQQMAASRWPDCEVEMNFGGQPVYFYIISVE